MLYLIEARCMGWEHEQVNAGFVAQLRQACPDESICFFADAGHLRCVNSIYGLEQGQVRACATSFPSKYEDCKEEARRYAAILVQILNNAGPDLTDVFLLSCCDGIALAVSALAPRYKVRFHLVFHARLERMLNQERRREQLFRQGEDPGEPTRLRTILEQMNDRSVELICYSPFYRRYLPGYLAPACIRRMIFLHHPFVQHAVTPTRHENAGLRIGVYAAAANDNACQVVRAVAERDPAGAVSFALLGGKQNPLEKEPSVERVLPGQRLSAGDIDRFVAGCDFILVPYDHTQYHITASGVFWDAMRGHTPVFSLGSPYFRFYEPYGFGVVEDSPEALAEAILRQAQDPTDFTKGINELLRACREENLCALREHLH